MTPMRCSRSSARPCVETFAIRRPLVLALRTALTLLALLLLASPSGVSAGDGASAPTARAISGDARGGLAPRVVGLSRHRDASRTGLAVTPRADEAGCATCNAVTTLDSPRFSHSNKVNNTWMPLQPGKQNVLQARSNSDGELLDHEVFFTVTDLVKVIGGVPCVVVWIQDFRDGELGEAVLAFFAQDDNGDLWFTGEYAEEYESGEFITAESSWIHGIEDSQAGVQVQQSPVIGASHQLANAPSIELLDCVRPISIQTRSNRARPKVCVPAGCFQELLTVRELAPLEGCPEILHRVYAKGVGIIQAGAPDDPDGETLVLMQVRQLNGRQMDEARAAALALDRHGPEVSEVYAETEPAFRSRANQRSGPTSATEGEWDTPGPGLFLGLGSNPVRRSTEISFGNAEAGLVELGIYDVAGRRVRSLVSRSEDAGIHQVR